MIKKEDDDLEYIIDTRFDLEKEYWAGVINRVAPLDANLDYETFGCLVLSALRGDDALSFRKKGNVVRISLKNSYIRSPQICAAICLMTNAYIASNGAGLSDDECLDRAEIPELWPHRRPPKMSEALFQELHRHRADLPSDLLELRAMPLEIFGWIMLPRLLAAGCAYDDDVLDLPPIERT